MKVKVFLKEEEKNKKVSLNARCRGVNEAEFLPVDHKNL